MKLTKLNTRPEGNEMITFEQKGDFRKTQSLFQRLLEGVNMSILDKYGKQGVDALRANTPKDSGKTADSWNYEIVHEKNSSSIYWTNSNINQGVNIAVILQYGHGTGTGGYVEGVDYINPAIKPVFEKIANEAWKELTK